VESRWSFFAVTKLDSEQMCWRANTIEYKSSGSNLKLEVSPTGSELSLHGRKNTILTEQQKTVALALVTTI